MFADRADAGRQLARALTRLRAEKPLILALPRGGVIVGAEIARALAGELDVMLVKKLRAPDNPELALGAVAEDGHYFVNEEVQRLTGANEDYLRTECETRLAEMEAQHRRYRQVRPRIDPTNRHVILVDDGLATGSTMIAAAQAVALAKPARVVVAVPVSPPDTIDLIRGMDEVQEVICLDTPAWFSGVGQFYENFTQVEDAEVEAILKRFAKAGS